MIPADRVFVIEAGHIMAFERSLGRDSTYNPHAIAPLTFSQAVVHYDPDTHLRPRAGQSWRGSGRTSSGAPSGGEGWLHAEQHFEYARHPRAGETLFASTRPGEQWAKPGSGGSVLEFADEITEFRDATGSIVLTSTIVRVRRTEAVS